MLIVNPNLCFDITVRLPELLPGAVSRATSTLTAAGGKGANVARAALAIGGEKVRLVGFLPDTDGPRLTALLAGEGIDFHPVPVAGVVRVSTILIEASGRVSVINGRGPDIDTGSWSSLVRTVDDLLDDGETLVCSGSVPPGVPTDAYAQLTAVAHAKGSAVVVDAAPAILERALTEGPDVVSPNLSEAEGMLYGRSSELVDEIGDDIPARALSAAAVLHRAGAVHAVVTAGASGAALCTADGSWWLPTAPVVVRNPIGAGDSFAAGAALALGRGESAVDVVRSGMASGSASVEQDGAGQVDPDRVTLLRQQIIAQACPIEATAG